MSKYIFRDEDLSGLIPYRNASVNKCIACDSNGGDTQEDFSNSEDFPAKRCLSCGLIWMQPSFNEEGLNLYYSNYIGKRRINNQEKMQQRQEQYKLDVDFIQKHISKGVMLDIGCNGGFFLNGFSDDFDKNGIEIDKSAVDYANENFDNLSGKVHCMNLQDYYSTAKMVGVRGGYDLITMRGVIEHVTDPVKDIKMVSNLLNPGGVFAVSATPNADAVSVDLYRDNWTLFHPIQHLWHFSPKTLGLISHRHGLELIASDFPYLGTPYENVHEDIKRVADRIHNKENNIEDLSISGAFYGNMMSLIFKKL